MTIRLAPTIDHRWRIGLIDGRQYAPVLSRIDGTRATFGRGGVLLMGPLMLWWCRDLYDVEVGP